MSEPPTFLVAWADPAAPLPDPTETKELRAAANDLGGDVLAASTVAEVVESASRQAPPWAAVARFDGAEPATRWYEQTRDVLAGTVLMVPAHGEPIWWPDELAAGRPGWSRRREVPDDRVGMFVSVWIGAITDLESMIDYSQRFRWTVERHGGVSVGNAPFPQALAGDAGPTAMTLMTWPDLQRAREWYETADYQPYRTQRHAASSATVIAFPALADATIPPRER